MQSRTIAALAALGLGLIGTISASMTDTQSIGAADAAACANPLPTGITAKFGKARGRVAEVGTVEIVSKQPNSVVAALSDPDSREALQIVTVGPNGSIRAAVQAGQYDVTLLSGNGWCNLDSGFQHGRKTRVRGGMQVRAETNTVLSLDRPLGGNPVKIGYEPIYQANSANPNSMLEVRNDGRGFLTVGTVNGRATSFLLDTGASLTTLPTEMAARAGVRCDQLEPFETASGKVMGCLARAGEVRFGPFTLRNVEVAVISGGTQAMIGFDVLRNFSVLIQGNLARISRNSSSNPQASPSLMAPLIVWPDQHAPQWPQIPVYARVTCLALLLTGALLLWTQRSPPTRV